MRAESINSGLSNYKVATCMYATGKGGGDSLKNASDGFLFVFDGGAPGCQEAGEPPTVETESLSLTTELLSWRSFTTAIRVNREPPPHVVA